MRAFNLVKSLTRVINNRKGLLILCLSLAVLGVESVWGAWSGSGQGTQVNGVWYALYDNTERKISLSLLGKHVEYNYKLSAPGSTLTFSAKRSKSAAVGNLRVGQNVGGTWSDIYDKNPTTSYETSGVLSLNVNATDLSFYNDYGSYDRYFMNVQVTMATYFEDPSKSELDFGSGAINTGSVSQDFTIAWCNTGTITSSLSAHSDVYTISISDNASAGHYGTATVTVTYNRNIKAGTHDATLTLTSGSTTKTITLTGTTTKLDPSITWSSEDATFNVDDVLSATNGAGLTVTLSSTGNEQYVNCSGNTATMLEATTGTITITANVTGNDIYNSKSFTKDITITNKEKQYITWNQDFSKLKTTDANKTIILNAKAVNKDGNETGLSVSYELVGDKTGLSLSQNGNTWTLTYSASACKNTTIVAKQEGNATYAPASNYSLPVKVIDPTQTCSTEETLINSDVKLENTSTYYNIDIPSSMTIDVRRSKTGIFDVYLQGFDVELYSGANAAGTQLSKESYSASDINNSKTIVLSNLNINAKSVKLISHANNGYTVSSLSYTHYKYCNTDKTALNYNTYPNTTTDAQTFTISYANYPIEIECSTNKLQIDKSSFGDCGVAGSETISVTYTTGVNTGKETEYIYVKDNTGAILQTITVTVSIQKVSQNITSTTIASSYKTTDKIELSATSNSGLTYFEYSCSPADVATFDGNIMTFNKSCANLSITVTQPGDNVYSPCSTTINNIVVSKVTPTIVVAPTTTAITYGQKLSESSLAGGAAKVNPFRGEAVDHSVTGSFAWTNGEYTIVEAGGTHEYDVTFTPSGTEAEMYNTVSGKATVTINKATPTLTAKNKDDLEVYVNDTQTPKLNLVDYITEYSAADDTHGHVQAKSAITFACNQNGAVIEGNKFYATKAGTYTITATAPATDYYNSQTTTFTIKAINYYYSQAKSIVATNTTTGKDGGWVSVWQNSKDSATIGDGSWLHEDQTSNYKKLTETTHPYYFRAKVGTGYTFAGWFTSAEATVSEYTKPTYDANFTVTNRDRENPWITRYAKFTPITYTVTFVGNGHTGGSMSGQTFTYDVPKNLATNGFTRTGWSFTGWKDGDGNTYTNEQSVNNLASTQGAVVTMTAQWSQDVYTVTLDPNPYGTGGTEQIEVRYNEDIPTSITPPDPTDPAYMFLGYYDGDTQYYNADGTAVSGKKWMFTEGKTLTAKWQTGDYIKSWNVAESYTAQSNIPYDIAKSFSERSVTYSIEGTDEGVITINNTSKYIYAIKKGKVMITACPVPSEGYSSFSCDTHEITVVGKEQKISWSQSFTFTTQQDGSIDETVALTAKAIDASTGVETGNSVWYSVGNSEMAEIIGDATIGYSLHVKRGTGSTTITAHVDGTEVYESGELEFTIRIYKYGDKCHVDVMTYPTEEQLGLESFLTSYKEEVTITKDRFTGAPTDSLYVQIMRNRNASGHLYISAYAGTDAALSVDYTDGDVNTDYQTYRFNLSLENVDNVKFASKSAFPYIIKDVRVTQKSYLRTDIAQVGQYYPIEAGIYVNDYYSKQFTISYSAKHQVMWQITNTSKKDDWNLRIVGHTKRNQSTTDYTNDCADWGTYTFELSTTHVWLTQEDIKDTITIKTSDGNDAIVIPVHLTVGLGALYQFAGTVDNNWSNKENWYKKGSTDPVTSLPDMRNEVDIYAPVRISESVSVYSLAVRANTATAGSVTIAPTGGLTVYNGGVTNPQNLDEYLIIESSQEHQGFFRMSPDASALMTPMPIATTQLATRSTLDEGANDDAVWQYIGTPAKTYDPSSRTLKDGLEFTVDYITWLYEWSEPKGWVDMKNVPQPVMLKPFTGYAITQYGKPVYEFTGQLLNSNVRIPLTYTDEPGMQGDNVIANSYTSPIDVTLVDQTDFEGGNVIQAFYVFNSGSYNQWKEQNKEGDGRGKQSGSLNNYTPGQYIAIPTKSGAALGENELTMIAPMQGFDIYATEKGKTAYFNLNYRKHVWNATNARGQMNQPLRAPKADDTYMPDDVARQYATWDSINAAKQACIDAITHRVRLIAYGENSGNDRVVIIESPLYAKQYENGADAPKMFAETDGLLGLYTNEQDCGLMSVNATNSVDGMFVGFRAGSDSEYELSASNVIGQPLRLIDLQTQQMIDLKDSATYTFTAEPNSQDDFRFQIVNQDIHVNPTGWGGLDAKAKIWYYKQTLYISDASANSTAAIYTADGVTLKQVTFNHNTTISTADMPEGVYTIRVEDSVLKFFVKH